MRRRIKLNVKNLVDVFAIHGKEKMDVTLAMANIVNTLALILVNLVATTAITRTLQTMHPVSADSSQHQNHKLPIEYPKCWSDVDLTTCFESRSL